MSSDAQFDNWLSREKLVQKNRYSYPSDGLIDYASEVEMPESVEGSITQGEAYNVRVQKHIAAGYLYGKALKQIMESRTLGFQIARLRARAISLENNDKGVLARLDIEANRIVTGGANKNV